MRKSKGFTLVELIVVMAILAILVLLGVPKYKNYVEEARFSKIKVNVKELENASMQYYMKHNDWPRLNDVPYTVEQISDFGKDILDKTGAIITLESEGKYYDINYEKLSNYVKLNDDNIRYILQNPVGSVFFIEGITEKGKARLESSEPVSELVKVYTPLKEYTTNTSFTYTTWANDSNHKIVGTLNLYSNNKSIYIDFPQFIIGQPFYCQYFIEIENGLNKIKIGWLLNNGTEPSNFKYVYLNNSNYIISNKMITPLKLVINQDNIKYISDSGEEIIMNVPFDIINGDVIIREKINYWYTPNKVPAGATIGVIDLK